LKARREISLLDKTGSSEIFEKIERRSSIRKGFRHEPSKQTLNSPLKSELQMTANSPMKSEFQLTATFGEVIDEDTKQRMLKDNSSTFMLEGFKKTETIASPTNKRASPFPTETTLKGTTVKSFVRRAKSSLRERVEKSILEAEEFLKKESWEIDNPFVGNILKKYATPVKPATRQNASFGVAVSAKALDSEKHTPFKVPNKKNQLLRFLKEEQVPENKFNSDFFKKSSMFYDYNYKERIRLQNSKIRVAKGNKSFL